jgi:hypothetical protein
MTFLLQIGTAAQVHLGWSAAVTMNGGGVPMQLHTIGIDLGKQFLS